MRPGERVYLSARVAWDTTRLVNGERFTTGKWHGATLIRCSGGSPRRQHYWWIDSNGINRRQWNGGLRGAKIAAAKHFGGIIEP